MKGRGIVQQPNEGHLGLVPKIELEAIAVANTNNLDKIATAITVRNEFEIDKFRAAF